MLIGHEKISIRTLRYQVPPSFPLLSYTVSDRKLGTRLCIKTFPLASAQLVRQLLSWRMASLPEGKSLSVFGRERAILSVYKQDKKKLLLSR